MNATHRFFATSFSTLALSLALSGISHAQGAPAAIATPTPTPTATATTSTATTPLRGLAASGLLATDNPAVTGNTMSKASTPIADAAQSGALPTDAPPTNGQAATGLVNVPDFPTAGLADAAERQATNVPPLTLEDAVLEALHNNPTPKAARAQLAAALARIGQTRASGKPTANLSGSSNYTRNFNRPGSNNSAVIDPTTGLPVAGSGSGSSSTANRSDDRSDQLSLNISLPLYTGGRVKNSKRQLEALARAQLASAQQTEQELAAQTILGYLSVLQRGELLQVAESNLDTSRERRRIAGVRFDAGAAARLEVLTADSDLATAAQSRIAAANNFAQSKAALNILLARNPETPIRVEPIETLQLPASVRFPLGDQASAIANGGVAPSSDDLRAAADASLPSLAAARETVNAGEFNVEAQKAQRKPSISASLTNLVRNPATFVSRFVLTAGLSVAQTLFSGGRIASQVAEARSTLDQSRFNLQGQQLQTANVIEGSLLTLDSSLKQLTSADVSVLSAQEALRAAQLSYSAGAGTQLDVINAQNSLVNSQTNAVNSRFSVASAQVQLAAATAITSTGSATGSSGLGSSAGTGQSSSFSASGATQSSGVNATGATTTNGSTNTTGTGTGTGTTTTGNTGTR